MPRRLRQILSGGSCLNLTWSRGNGQCRARAADWEVEPSLEVSTSVAIVAISALLIFGLVVVLRAEPTDIPKIIEFLTRWFRK